LQDRGTSVRLNNKPGKAKSRQKRAKNQRKQEKGNTSQAIVPLSLPLPLTCSEPTHPKTGTNLEKEFILDFTIKAEVKSINQS